MCEFILPLMTSYEVSFFPGSLEICSRTCVTSLFYFFHNVQALVTCKNIKCKLTICCIYPFHVMSRGLVQLLFSVCCFFVYFLPCVSFLKILAQPALFLGGSRTALSASAPFEESSLSALCPGRGPRISHLWLLSGLLPKRRHFPLRTRPPR